MSTAGVQDFRQFASNRLFEGIESNLLGEIAPQVGVRRYAPDELIFHEGDAGDSLYLVGEGSVKISKRGRGGGPEVLGYIQPGNFFGEMALLDGEPRSATATAAGPVVLGQVKEKTFQHILELAPARLHMNFLRSVSERLRNINSHFINEVMRTERLSLVGSMANGIIHDLKNPVSIVRCCVGLIENETTDPKLREVTKMLNDAVNGMLAMMQELLDYARGQDVVLDKKPISIWGFLHELNKHCLYLLPAKKIQFVQKIGYDGEIEVDLPRFTRVLSNIIKNAREAMMHGGTLTFATSRVGQEVSLQVTDTGVGIPARLLPRLFDPFVTEGKSGGTGLGLAIAKSIVEAHRGQITVVSKEGEGTTFEIRLPLPAAQVSDELVAPA
jgi:signal transduction histidine kinase